MPAESAKQKLEYKSWQDHYFVGVQDFTTKYCTKIAKMYRQRVRMVLLCILLYVLDHFRRFPKGQGTHGKRQREFDQGIHTNIPWYWPRGWNRRLVHFWILSKGTFQRSMEYMVNARENFKEESVQTYSNIAFESTKKLSPSYGSYINILNG